ncbi:DUF4190 domain-containing protein [Amycolatopsis thermalba]|uniref:DUF4190 domain-containing protein n=1 Tax=Amycolatopsis thermalba TaxID=944492 RepID=A0ABY4P3S0_9PSEU|nr:MULTISPECIES: DUF4190 domain-containing protein [Amycolatopsis]UQS26858.1 DUF4190 domain-containing protein [Amycolatopsis thermalba]
MTQPYGQWPPQQQQPYQAPYPPQGWQQQYPQYQVYPQQAPVFVPQNSMGTAALALGIIGLFVMPFLGVLAIVFGSIGISRANQRLATNGGAATWGLILGIFEVVVLVVYLAVWV